MDKTAAAAIVSLYDRLRSAEPIIRYAKAQKSFQQYIAEMRPVYDEARRVSDPTVTVLRVGERVEAYADSADAYAAQNDYLAAGVKQRQMSISTVGVTPPKEEPPQQA
jgi:hypothetical protein